MDATPPQPPMPGITELTRFFWDGVNRHELWILRCDECQRYIHWPRPVCRFCLATSLSPAQVSGRGHLETFTIPMLPFDTFNAARVPYVLAVVGLEEQPGLKMVSNIIDCDEADLRIDMPLVVEFVAVSDALTLPFFRPADSADHRGASA